ncbi:hypothetical protein Acsp02_65450 [Actinoplanes sp. NBRC 103695]|nr:hypothetical protein Acsp02_65450 [Actinoplanes sp. NBRC 103695]
MLVHGSSGGLDSWDPVAPFLEDRYELWVYARRGYAPSDPCRRSKTYADDVADLRAVIAAAGGTAHVVGGSYGATVALHAAGESVRGLTVQSLALFEPPLFAAGEATAGVLGPYRDLLEDGKVRAAALLFAEKVARVPAPILAALTGAEPADESNEGPTGESNEGPADGSSEAVGCLHDLEAMTADSLDVNRWSAVSLPTLIMQGGETWAPMPATMDALAAAMPAATRVVLPGQMHFATHTAPELVTAELAKFLSSARSGEARAPEKG